MAACTAQPWCFQAFCCSHNELNEAHVIGPWGTYCCCCYSCCCHWHCQNLCSLSLSCCSSVLSQTAPHLKGLKKKEKKTNFKFIYLAQTKPTSHAHWHWLTTSACASLPSFLFATLFRPTANFHMATFEYCSDCSSSSGQRMSLPQQTNTIWIYPSPFPFPSAPFPSFALRNYTAGRQRLHRTNAKHFLIESKQHRREQKNPLKNGGENWEKGVEGGRKRATATDTEVDRLMPLDGNDLIGVDWKSANQLVLHMIRCSASPTACQSQRCVCVICWQKSHFMRHKITV